MIVGLTTAKAIALVAQHKPLIAVNHLEAHALTARLTDGVDFPYCLFLASGGHTQIVAVRGVGDYVLLGNTMDDAIGEAFDKTAKLLGLGYPGGPQVEKHGARTAIRTAFALPRPMRGPARAGFLLFRTEDGIATGSRADRAAVRSGHRRSVRLVPAGVVDTSTTGCGPDCACSPSAMAGPMRWSPPAASPPTRRCARCCSGWRSEARIRAGGAAARACAPTMAR